jgi:hypothetical protein
MLGHLVRKGLQIRVNERFTDLVELANLAERSIREGRAKISADAMFKEIQNPGEWEDHEIERYQDEMRQFGGDFPQLLRASSLASTQAVLESFLLRIARSYATSSGTTFDQAVWMKAGGRIWGVKAYLHEDHGKSGASEYWTRISDYVNVRNAIAHGDGLITNDLKDRTASEVSADRLEHVTLQPVLGSTDIQILLNAEAVEDFIKTARWLCVDLLR